jgi:hypothetical protein
MTAVGIGAIAVAALAVLARSALGGGPHAVRIVAAAAALLTPIAIAAWYETGPARSGWAKRAGTPTALLARPVVVQAAAPRRTLSTALVRASFSARLDGTVKESNAGGDLVTVVIAGRLTGGAGGAVRIDLRGVPEGGGVTMTASGVSYVPAGSSLVYTGNVTSLSGQDVAASVKTASGSRLDLTFALNIDLGSGVASGTVSGAPA